MEVSIKEEYDIDDSNIHHNDEVSVKKEVVEDYISGIYDQQETSQGIKEEGSDSDNEGRTPNPLKASPSQNQFFQSSYSNSPNFTTQNEDSSYPCTVCAFATHALDQLEIHMVTHTGSNYFDCPVCEYKAQEESVIKRHVVAHMGDASFSCSYCEYVTKNTDSYDLHMNFHPGKVKLVMCNILQCEYSNCDYKTHLYIHKHRRPFACTECDYRCTNPTGLKSHWLIHRPKKPFIYTDFEYKCTDTSSVKSNILGHQERKPYTCPECDYTCPEPNVMKSHIQSHQEKTPSPCRESELKTEFKSEYSFTDNSSNSLHRSNHSLDFKFDGNPGFRSEYYSREHLAMPPMAGHSWNSGQLKHPKGRLTPYSFFVQNESRKLHPGDNIKFVELSQQCSDRWKIMTEEEKIKYYEMARYDKERYAAEMTNWAPPSEDYRMHSRGRRSRRRRRVRSVKDPNKPKRALSAFLFYANEVRPKTFKANPDFTVGQVAKELGRQWSALTEFQKAPYEKSAEEDRGRYHKAMEKYKSGDLSFIRLEPKIENLFEDVDEHDLSMSMAV